MNPITREEKLLDGQVLEPITRKEAFIRRIYDKTQAVPEPITREEWFLNKAAEGSGGDVTIEKLNVTQNGTYSEQGKAYSPVVVDVPEAVLTTKNITANGTYSASADNADGFSSVEVAVAPPENSYLLTTKKDDVVDISDAASIPIVDLKADVSAVDEVIVGVGDGDEFIADNAPYLFRKTLNRQSNVKQVAEKIVGASVAWNQIAVANNTHTENDVVVTRKSNNVVNLDGTANASGLLNTHQTINVQAGHVYLLTMNKEVFDTGATLYTAIGGHVALNSSSIRKASSSSTATIASVSVRCNSGTVFDNVDAYVDIFDLTITFGTTIADYVNTLESSQEGSGIAYLKSYGFFTKDHYNYNAGGIESVKTSAHKTVGFNQWDEEWENGYISVTTGENVDTTQNVRSKNYIPALPNTTYYLRTAFTEVAWCPILFYDENKNFISANEQQRWNRTVTTPSNAHYMRFYMQNTYGTTYNHDVCINLHWDGERDGQYEEYKEHTYPLDSDLELRGIPKLDTNNKLYYDGDTYASDGTVTRKYGIVDLGSLTWTYKANTFGGSFSSTISNAGYATTGNSICAKYPTVFSGTDITNGDKVVYTKNNGNTIHIKDSAYSDAATFKTAMSGVYLVYELATPTTESAEPYTSPQIVDNWGTEEYVDERTVPIPVGHSTKYFDGKIYHSYLYDANGDKVTVTGTADLITGEVTGSNHCDTFVIQPSGDNVVAESGEVEVKYLVPLEAI